MNVGRARHRITVTCSTPASGTSGQADYIGGTETTLIRWGQVRSIKGKLDDQGMQQTEGRRFFQIKMRYDSGINYGCRLTYKGREMAIERIEDVREIEHELIIYAFEVDL